MAKEIEREIEFEKPASLGCLVEPKEIEREIEFEKPASLGCLVERFVGP
jgi:hypothetical protein